MSYKSFGQKFSREGKDNRLDARANVVERERKTEVWAVKSFGGSSMQKSKFSASLRPSQTHLLAFLHCLVKTMLIMIPHILRLSLSLQGCVV